MLQILVATVCIFLPLLKEIPSIPSILPWNLANKSNKAINKFLFSGKKHWNTEGSVTLNKVTRNPKNPVLRQKKSR